MIKTPGEEDEEDEDEEDEEDDEVDEGMVGHWAAPELCGELHSGIPELGLELGFEPKEKGSGA